MSWAVHSVANLVNQRCHATARTGAEWYVDTREGFVANAHADFAQVSANPFPHKSFLDIDPARAIVNGACPFTFAPLTSSPTSSIAHQKRFRKSAPSRLATHEHFYPCATRPQLVGCWCGCWRVDTRGVRPRPQLEAPPGRWSRTNRPSSRSVPMYSLGR